MSKSKAEQAEDIYNKLAPDWRGIPTKGKNMTEQEKIKQAISLLDQATTLVYNIEGDKWQMTYELLEVLLNNLRIEQVIG